MAELVSTTPNYLKRSAPDVAIDPHLAKKRRIYYHCIHHKQTLPDKSAFVPQDDEAVHSLLTRSLGIALHDAGFSGADPTAVESFRCEVEEFITHFLDSVTRSMLSCRRSYPIPQDFTFALAMQNLTVSSLIPHLQLKVPPDISQPSLPTPPPEEALERPLSPILGTALSGSHDKQQRRYIPIQFPSFPSRHTYKHTAEWTHREEDPRRIREKATEEGRMGEEALRRLASTKAAQNSQQAVAGVREGSSGQKRKERGAMWENMIEAVRQQKSKPILPNGDADRGLDDPVSDKLDGLDVRTRHRVSKADLRVLVNYERPYWRKDAQSERPKLRQAASLANGLDRLK
ncbi:MAG: hypothetical protein M1836_002864 [Candelina mexicana]|nr:MAG: hypothetical protein M1836_002864 [Candelina mexicana]